eukprot:Nk52_evm46s1401 gene=Nk52_evmTU46s1401
MSSRGGGVKAGEVFCENVLGFVSRDQLEEAMAIQLKTKERFEEINEKLTSINQYSAREFREMSKAFKDHTTLLLNLKKNLDSLAKRIRVIKTQVQQKYPKEYIKFVQEADAEESEEEDEQGEEQEQRQEKDRENVKEAEEEREQGHEQGHEQGQGQEQGRDQEEK